MSAAVRTVTAGVHRHWLLGPIRSNVNQGTIEPRSSTANRDGVQRQHSYLISPRPTLQLGGRQEPPAKREPPEDRTAVTRPQRSFWVSRWAGGRPPKGRPPAQRETPFHEEAGSE
ncbi:hypothetical protein NDU88_000899 [Pleurodeles waltl]|uniref:Uncharacterized protein n=1 Tax=Pleurodeles waltl TaxID=8319 RepID=A0AAV7M3R4_PLEWA|nr:hypothetical protein NDU88_000899 [Pleurodeles waltl]